MEIIRRAWRDFRHKLRELIRFNRRHVAERAVNAFSCPLPSFPALLVLLLVMARRPNFSHAKKNSVVFFRPNERRTVSVE